MKYITTLLLFSLSAALYSVPTDSLDRIITTSKSPERVVQAMMQKADMLSEEHIDKAKQLFREAGLYAEKSELYQLQTDADLKLGRLFLRVNAYDSALIVYKKCFETAEMHDLKQSEIRSIDGEAKCYFYKGDFPESLVRYYKALEKLKKNSNDTLKADVLNSIAGVHWSLKDYPKTLEFLQQSLEIKTKIGDSVEMARTYNNMGNVYADMADYDKALEYYHKDLQIALKKANPPHIAISYSNIASVYRGTGNHDKAIEYAQKALEIDLATSDLFGQAADYVGLANSYYELKQYAKTENYFNKALIISEQIKADKLKMDLFGNFSTLYTETKDFEKALEYYKRFSVLKDSLLNETKNRQIVEADKKYETEKKNTEIQRLKVEQLKDENLKQVFRIIIGSLALIALLLIVLFRQRVKTNRTLNEKNRELERLTSTQNRLMSIISHDLKSPLSAFYSITDSLKSKIDSIEKSEIEHYLARMQNSSLAVKLQLENMLNWAVNQSRDIHAEKSNFDLSVLVMKVSLILQEFANEKSVSIEQNIPESFEVNTDGRLLNIVLNNLISNAVKYSNRDGKVIVSAKETEGKCIISVKDFGKGMSKTQLASLFSETNEYKRDVQSGTGLGLIVSKDIVEKLDGNIRVESEEGKGSEFIIEFQK